jgi:hypothetical protein
MIEGKKKQNVRVFWHEIKVDSNEALHQNLKDVRIPLIKR